MGQTDMMHEAYLINIQRGLGSVKALLTMVGSRRRFTDLLAIIRKVGNLDETGLNSSAARHSSGAGHNGLDGGVEL